MRRNWKLIILIIMFAAQTAFVYVQDQQFEEGMRYRRELVLQDSAAGKIPAEQAASVASALLETGYQVSSYVRNALLLSLMFNFVMLFVVISDRQKEAD